MSGLQWNHKIFNVKEQDFASLALQIFQHQAVHNRVYSAYLDALQVDPKTVNSINRIPFLPISFFKTEKVITGPETGREPVFESSGTSGITPSRHFVKDPALYEQSFLQGFERTYGNPRDWCILGLLPSYLERENSSLVYMLKRLMEISGHPDGGFFLDDMEALAALLARLDSSGVRSLLIGVSFALLDFAEKYPMPLKNTVIMETGGMKGRRQELVREELHERLIRAFSVESVHSEYGMTELLSQSYSRGDGRFISPPWMNILLRDEEDPLSLRTPGIENPVTGAINVIDLANVHSCSFIATDDIGRLHPGGSFEVLGRMDGSDLRGCSLLVVEN